MTDAPASRQIQSLRRMDMILAAIAGAPGGAVRLTELAAITALHKNTAFSLLRTMSALGYVSQDSVTQAYRIGRRAFELAHQAERQLDIIDIVRPSMLRLVHQFRESVSLAVPGPAAGIVVATIEGSYGVRGTRFQGQSAPYNASALGKALLVAMPDGERRALLGQLKLERFTSRTIVTTAELVAECEAARARGFALSIAEEEVGASAVAVGLRARCGTAAGALAIWGPTVRLTRQRLAELGQHLRAETHGLMDHLVDASDAA